MVFSGEKARREILYEEMHPYGTSAYRSAASAVEVSARRYRYTGKERDEETGLDYFGARYYAPWLGRWTSADPLGLQAGLNLYLYCRGSPIVFMDPNGMEEMKVAVPQSTAIMVERRAEAEIERRLWQVADYLSSPTKLVTAQDLRPLLEPKSTPTGGPELRGPDEVRGQKQTLRPSPEAPPSQIHVQARAKAPGGQDWEYSVKAESGEDIYKLGVAASIFGPGAAAGLARIGSGGLAGGVVAAEGSSGVLRSAPKGPPTSITVDGRTLELQIPPQLPNQAQVGSVRFNLPGAKGRTWLSSDPLVGDLATKIDAAYPGHVVAVNLPVRGASGKLVTDIDILLQNSALQVKSGGGTGLTKQVTRSVAAFDLPVIGYGPDLGPHVQQSVAAAGGLPVTSEELLMQLIRP